METKKAMPGVKTSMASVEVIRSDVSQMLRDIAGPVEPGTSLKAIWRNLSIKLRLTVGQVTRLWYENWLTIPAHVYLAVRTVWDRQRLINARLADAVDARAVAFTDRRARLMEATRA